MRYCPSPNMFFLGKLSIQNVCLVPAGLKLGPRFDFDSLTDVPCATVATFQVNED